MSIFHNKWALPIQRSSSNKGPGWSKNLAIFLKSWTALLCHLFIWWKQDTISRNDFFIKDSNDITNLYIFWNCFNFFAVHHSNYLFKVRFLIILLSAAFLEKFCDAHQYPHNYKHNQRKSRVLIRNLRNTLQSDIQNLDKHQNTWELKKQNP